MKKTYEFFVLSAKRAKKAGAFRLAHNAGFRPLLPLFSILVIMIVFFGPLAQLDRAPAFEAGCRQFDSAMGHTCGSNTTVVCALPKPDTRVRLPSTALGLPTKNSNPKPFFGPTPVYRLPFKQRPAGAKERRHRRERRAKSFLLFFLLNTNQGKARQ